MGAGAADVTSTVRRVVGSDEDGNTGRRVDETKVDGDETRGGKRVPVSPNENDESVARRTGASVLLERAWRSLRRQRKREREREREREGERESVCK